MLMDEATLKARCNKARYDILRRAKSKLWKSGKRKGLVRKAGITELTFTSAQLWQRALSQVGPSAIPCPYCLEIGRPAFIITLANYVWDHKVPVTQGGQPVLGNLFAVCEDCNKLKGSMSYAFFIALMSAIEKWEEPKDRSYLHACLRTHGKVINGFRGNKKEVSAPEVVIMGNLLLSEDF